MPRRLLYVLIGLVVLIGGSIAVVLLVNKSPKLQNAVYQISNVSHPTTTAKKGVSTNTNVASADRVQVIYVARTFAEQFGSGSNQDNFSNIIAVQSLATKSYADYLRAQVAQGRLHNVTVPYHGYVTKALVITITNLTPTAAAATVSTDRQETIGPKTTEYHQDLQVQLVKTGTAWQVNTATWSPQ